MPKVILEYSEQNYAKVEERARINSRPIGEWLKRFLPYPAKNFDNCTIEKSDKPNYDNAPVYKSDKPKKYKKVKR